MRDLQAGQVLSWKAVKKVLHATLHLQDSMIFSISRRAEGDLLKPPSDVLYPNSCARYLFSCWSQL